jgi:hypothetical protein
MVEVSVPPGFEFVSESVQALIEAGSVDSFSATEELVTLYVPAFTPGQVLELPLRLRARYPVKALARGAVAYPYYEPEARAASGPVMLIAQ